MQNEMLKIRVLGPVEIVYGREIIKINRRIERSILYILAIEQQPISRTRLMDMLWPNAEEIDPRASLRTALSRLKRELPDPNLVLTELDNVQLDVSRCEIDLIEFKNHYQSLYGPLSAYPSPQPFPKQIVNQIQEALALWRGDSLIQGEILHAYPEIEIWQQTHDHQYRQQRQFLMNKLAQHFQAAGQPETALECYRELGRLDILNIPTHLSILDLLMQLGRQKEAMEHCDLLETAYEKQFNAPLPDAILQKCHLVSIQTQPDTLQSSNNFYFPLSMQLPIVGREEELSQLRQAFFTGGVVVIRGNLGIGKTRLVQELLQTLHVPQLFIAPCVETDAALPFSPIIHGLRHHLTQDIFTGINRVWANQLQLLLPDLADIREDIDDPSNTDIPFGKQHLFEALYQIFLFVSKKNGKMLFFLDDAQWADSQTLQALSYLISKDYFKSNGLLVIASRNVDPVPKLEEMIDRFYRSHPFQIIDLLELNPVDLKKLAEQALTKPAPTSFINKLYQESQGNPFLALEIIRSVLDNEENIENLDDLPIPESLQALIKARLNKLGDASRRVLQCAAVMGSAFSVVQLQSLAEIDEKELHKILQLLISYGLINPTPEENLGELTLTFSHQKVRDVVLQETPPLNLRLLHKMAAEQLKFHSQKIEKANTIANHYLEAGEIIKAYKWFIKSATHAWKLDAKDDALDAFRQAESLTVDRPKGLFSNDDILALYNPWISFAYEIDDQNLLEEIGIKLRSLGDDYHAPLLIGVAYIALSNSCLLRLQHDTALEFIQRAINNLQQKGSEKYLARAHLFYGIYNWWRLDFDEEIKSALRTIELCNLLDLEDMEVMDLIAHAGHMVSMAYYGKGDANKALHYAQDTYDKYFPYLHSYQQVRVLDSLAYAYFLAGNYQLSEQYSNETLEVSKGLGNDFVEEFLLITRAKAFVIQGYLDQAYQDATREISLGEENNRPHTIIAANTILGDIFFTLQNPSKALQYYRTAQVREGFPLKSIQGIENGISLARLLTWMRQLDDAENIIESILEITTNKGLQSMHTQTLITSGYCNLFRGDKTRAKHQFDQASNHASELGLNHELLRCKKGQARLAFVNGDLEHAEALLEEILEESKENQYIYINFLGWRMYVKLMAAKNHTSISSKNRSNFLQMLKVLEENTVSDPLRAYFEETKRRWSELGFIL